MLKAQGNIYLGQITFSYYVSRDKATYHDNWILYRTKDNRELEEEQFSTAEEAMRAGSLWLKWSIEG